MPHLPMVEGFFAVRNGAAIVLYTYFEANFQLDVIFLPIFFYARFRLHGKACLNYK
jgi:hypothetical protein